MESNIVRKIGAFLGSLLHGGLLAVGAITTITFLKEEYAVGYSYVTNTLYAVAAVWFIVTYAVIPYIKGRREGLGIDT